MFTNIRSMNSQQPTVEQVAAEMDPLNLNLLSIKNKSELAALGEISVPDMYAGNTLEYHPAGLYSSDVFGFKGSDARMTNLGYISLNTDIIIPDVYKQLKKARSLYEEIMRGTAYVVFNSKLKDFEPTPLEEGGQTGYSYFIKYLPELEPENTGASTRKRLIRLLNQQRTKLTTRYYIVIPAGYRDVEQQPDGRMKSDEINELYLALLRAASLIAGPSSSYDSFRFQAQRAANAISDYIDLIIYGKSGLINAKFAKRGVRQGTRNVITSQIHNVSDLESPSNLGMLDSTMGLPQALAMFPDKILFHLRTLLTPIMPEVGYDFTVIDPKTYESTAVSFDGDLYNLLMTSSGFTQLIRLIRVKDNRVKKLTYGKYWLGALYKPTGRVQVVSDQSNIEDFNPTDLHPITIVEILYIAMMRCMKELTGTSTRPPVLGKGGIGQSMFVPYLADPFEVRSDIDTGDIGSRYPIMTYIYEKNGDIGDQTVELNGTFNDSTTVSELRMGALTLDFDGDMMTGLPITTNEAREEIIDSFGKASTYLNTEGKLLYKLGGIDVANNIMLTLTS